MSADHGKMLCMALILAGLLAGCAGNPGSGTVPGAAADGAALPRLRGCGPRPVPDEIEPPPFEEARAAADLVFVGRHLGADDPIPLSMAVPAEDMYLDHSFEVYRLWDGEPAETLLVRSYREAGSGGYPFRKGSVYLIYAVREPDRLWASRCSRTALVTGAYADIFRLGEPVYDAQNGLLPSMDPQTLAFDLRSPELTARVQALRVMEQIAPADPRVIPIMIEGLSLQKGIARLDFVAALGRLGSYGGPAVAALLPLLNDEDTALRATTVSSLGKIGTVDPAVLPALVASLVDEDPAVRATAAQAIGGLGADGASAAPALRELLDDPQPRVRDMASRALQLLGAASR